MSKVEKGQTVKVHYRGTFTDGQEFDNSQVRGRPINFIVGEGNVIKGFETAVIGMAEGETKSITLPPESAYGPINPEAVIEVEKERFPSDFAFVKDGFVRSTRFDGRPVFGKITEIKDESVVLDVNHPMAGKELNFEIQLVEIEESQVETEEAPPEPEEASE
jgi:FKBP-type peptidyl-prolyl cis-trans isomerase 2